MPTKNLMFRSLCVVLLGLFACPSRNRTAPPPSLEESYEDNTQERLDEVVAGKGLDLSPELQAYYDNARVSIEALQRGEFAKALRLAEAQIAREADGSGEDNPYLHLVAGSAEVAAAFVPLWKHYQQLRIYYFVVKVVLWLPADMQEEAIRLVIREAVAAAGARAATGEPDSFEKINWKQLAASGKMIRTGFDKADAHLLKARQALGIQLILCPSCWRVDWNDDGVIDPEDAFWEIEYDAKGAPIPSSVDSYLRNPSFRFDVGDVAWLRAMISFQRGIAEVIAAYDWTELPTLLHSDTQEITLRLIDAASLRSAKQYWIMGLRHSALSRALYLTETDDYLEWVANPSQKSQPFPETLSEAGYEGWKFALDEFEGILMGRGTLPLQPLVFVLSEQAWENDPEPMGINIKRLLDAPNDIVINRAALKQVADSRSLVDLRALLQIAFPDRIVPATAGVFDRWREAVTQAVRVRGSSMGRHLMRRRFLWVN